MAEPESTSCPGTRIGRLSAGEGEGGDARRIVRSAWGITFWTAISRLAGFLRVATEARFLGAGLLSDAYVTAFRIPNTFRAIVGEGGLPGAFVPIAKKVQRERPGEEGLYAGRVLTLLLMVLLGLVTVGIALAPFVVRLFASGFTQNPAKFDLTVTLTRWLFPYILFISAASVLEAYLNAKGSFQLSAATPIVWNLAVVAAAYALVPFGVKPLVALSTGLLLGGVLQFAMQVPLARRLGFRFGGAPLADPEVRRTAVQIAPRLYGYGVGQLNFLISNRILSSLGDAFVTYNFYAFRITDLVRGGFVESVTRAILPSLAEKALDEDRSAFRQTIAFGLRIAAFVTLPATAGLILLAAPILDVLLRRGKFGVDDVAGTALALAFYALGLFAIAAVKVLTQAFYALHDTRTPVFVGTFDLIAFWLICLALAGPMKHAGVALATSAGFWINALLLYALLRRRLGRIEGRALLASLGRVLAATLAMSLALIAVAERLLPFRPGWNLALRAGWVAGLVVLAAAVFLGAATLLGAPEVDEVLGALRRRKKAA